MGNLNDTIFQPVSHKSVHCEILSSAPLGQSMIQSLTKLLLMQGPPLPLQSNWFDKHCDFRFVKSISKKLLNEVLVVA